MGSSHKTKILFLAPYPFGKVASQRFRFEQYWDILEDRYELHFHPFLSDNDYSFLYSKGKIFEKTLAVVSGFLRRISLLFTVSKFDFVFIHREASPVGPPFIEWILIKIFFKKIIYDFDDAIWLENTSGENRVASIFKCSWKVKYICSWVDSVTCGNNFLCNYSRKFNQNIIYIPTTLDIQLFPKKTLKSDKFKLMTIGWTGTHSTLKYLDKLVPVLQKLQKQIHFQFLVIADKDPKLQLEHYTFIPWNKKSEWADLSKLDIGIMPLENTEWEEGKCGFKALQYMALGIPTLASPTAANCNIIEDGVNGFICRSEEEWMEKILLLLSDNSICEFFSVKGRLNIQEKFSKKAWEETYLSLFKS